MSSYRFNNSVVPIFKLLHFVKNSDARRDLFKKVYETFLNHIGTKSNGICTELN